MTVAAGEEVVGVRHVFVTHVGPDFVFDVELPKAFVEMNLYWKMNLYSREGQRK
jgi:hypothetical protein